MIFNCMGLVAFVAPEACFCECYHTDEYRAEALNENAESHAYLFSALFFYSLCAEFATVCQCVLLYRS